MSAERDQEIYRIGAKEFGDFQRRYPELDNITARALIQAIEAVRPHFEADALRSAAGDYSDVDHTVPGNTALVARQWLRERADWIERQARETREIVDRVRSW